MWEMIGLLSAVVIWGGTAVVLLFPYGKDQLDGIAACAKRAPFRAALGAIVVGVAIAYGGSKGSKYKIEFEQPQAFEPRDSKLCETGMVYELPALDGYRWRANVKGVDRLYDGGMLIFNLAQPGETVKMTATCE